MISRPEKKLSSWNIYENGKRGGCDMGDKYFTTFWYDRYDWKYDWSYLKGHLWLILWLFGISVWLTSYLCIINHTLPIISYRTVLLYYTLYLKGHLWLILWLFGISVYLCIPYLLYHITLLYTRCTLSFPILRLTVTHFVNCWSGM